MLSKGAKMSTVVNFRVDEDIKKSADQIFSTLGLTMSSALNMFLHATVREGNLPFQTKPVTTDEVPRFIPENLSEIASRIPLEGPINKYGATVAPAEEYDHAEDELYAEYL